MKFIVSKKRFMTALRSVAPAASTRSTLPVLRGVRIEASRNGLILEATDLEVAVCRTVDDEIRVKNVGALVVPAKALSNAVRSMPQDEIVIEREGADVKPRLSIGSGARHVVLDCHHTEDYPTRPDASQFDDLVNVDAPALSEALVRASLCASDDQARPTLTAVALFARQESQQLEVVATDSYRLGALTVSTASPATRDASLLIPAHAVRAFAKQARKEQGEVVIGLDGSDGTPTSVRFAIGSMVWTMRLVEGEYPNWRQLLPDSSGASLVVDSTELDSALKAVRSVSSDRRTPVRLQLGATCSIALTEQDAGSVRETLQGASYTPDGVGDIEVAFNPEYLADALRFCGEEQVHVSVRDGLKPALFGTSEVRYLLMPVRTS